MPTIFGTHLSGSLIKFNIVMTANAVDRCRSCPDAIKTENKTAFNIYGKK